jgi:hypothetical protein
VGRRINNAAKGEETDSLPPSFLLPGATHILETLYKRREHRESFLPPPSFLLLLFTIYEDSQTGETLYNRRISHARHT